MPRMTNDDGCPQGMCHNEPYGEEDMHTEEKFWYALRVTYARELKVKQSFDEKGIESYVPMRMVERRFFGKRRKKENPVPNAFPAQDLSLLRYVTKQAA